MPASGARYRAGQDQGVCRRSDGWSGIVRRTPRGEKKDWYSDGISSLLIPSRDAPPLDPLASGPALRSAMSSSKKMCGPPWIEKTLSWAPVHRCGD